MIWRFMAAIEPRLSISFGQTTVQLPALAQSAIPPGPIKAFERVGTRSSPPVRWMVHETRHT